MKLKTIVTNPKLNEFGLPKRETAGSAALDLRAIALVKPGDQDFGSITLQPGHQIKVSTGIKLWIEDPNFVGLVFARSGLGSKGLVLGNGTGVIDSDYQGELVLTLLNRGKVPQQINCGDRVAQLVVVGVAAAEIDVVETFDVATERGEGGMGSTGAA